MGLQGPKTAEWFGRAKAALVNGVSSGWRYWGDDDTLVLAYGEGAYVYDSDGKRYIDFHNGFGPVILGHGHPAVTEAVAEAVSRGTTFAFTQEREVAAAEAVKEAVPWIEQLRFTNTGTEATMHAVRLARGFTGPSPTTTWTPQTGCSPTKGTASPVSSSNPCWATSWESNRRTGSWRGSAAYATTTARSSSSTK